MQKKALEHGFDSSPRTKILVKCGGSTPSQTGALFSGEGSGKLPLRREGKLPKSASEDRRCGISHLR